MSCPDGATWQCSGGTILRTEPYGIALTSSSVQAYGKSTSDLAKQISDPATASGFAPASGGVAEIRLNKAAGGSISAAALLLNGLGISWDSKTERPAIIETFTPTQGMVQLDANGALHFIALPDSSNLSFYDFAVKGAAGTQANYANNRYFPRSSSNPPRCQAGALNCQNTETDGIQYQQGGWRTGGAGPDGMSAVRLHEDGDIHAGNSGQTDANGNPVPLPGGSGIGVSAPGTKGYRSLNGWSYQYANLGAWLTQDTVDIAEWSAASNEHNQNRRGFVAFGAVTDPAAVPSTGTASYSGMVEGWYGKNASDEPAFFHGNATITVNFATREVVVNVDNTVSDNAGATVPVAFNATVGAGAAGSNVANYLTGTVDNGKLKGGVSGRFFGTVAGGGSGSGPAEVGGAISLSNGTTGETVVGGFIGRKQ